MLQEYQIRVNGTARITSTDRERPLLDVLREDWHLTGTKFGCGEGECGACTVLINGKPTRSCQTPIGQVGDAEVTTIEGVAPQVGLHPVQQAFIDHQAMQCGYCVPGHIMTALALVRDQPTASQAEVIDTMSQHICRCCNYENILAAVTAAVANAMKNYTTPP
jgi:aerobic-type carbon monoxide dehydrogenase small subunit (CoxS/CutS family)